MLGRRAASVPCPDGGANLRGENIQRTILLRLAAEQFARLAECMEALEIALNERLFLRPRPALQLGFAGPSLRKRGVNFHPQE